ncbi:MAG: hypothetical protein RM368_37195 [Nostoc sp. DedSLP03]|uniref:hypothetical protein n=1 Tax=Nostoc sp. DedSLP03 TaxID=3075400 RepID=UPI002AD2FF51|nr:hypothetical protein [Nostoc sp. DedSLP03]MDZ7970503.1 hypothetical protein [Nostoc sp. DedSLP03]
MHPHAELIALEGRCPTCGNDNLTFVTYDLDNEAVFDCDNCGESESIPLTDLKEFGFYPENFENISNDETCYQV